MSKLVDYTLNRDVNQAGLGVRFVKESPPIFSPPLILGPLPAWARREPCGLVEVGAEVADAAGASRSRLQNARSIEYGKFGRRIA